MNNCKIDDDQVIKALRQRFSGESQPKHEINVNEEQNAREHEKVELNGQAVEDDLNLS